VYDVILKKGKLRKSTCLAAGYDLFATIPVIVPVGKRVVIPTGVFTTMRSGVVGLIQDRSSLAVNEGVTTLAGVIDADYTKEWHVVLLNTGVNPVVVREGDRVAQVVFVNHLHVDLELRAPGNINPVEAEIEYGNSREGGFGSTGK